LQRTALRAAADAGRYVLSNQLMSKAEGIKEELGWLKVVFGVLVAVDVSLVAWVAQNFSSPDRVLVWGAILAVAVVTAGVVSINRLAIVASGSWSSCDVLDTSDRACHLGRRPGARRLRSQLSRPSAAR